MKNLMTSTAVVLMLGSGAFAESNGAVFSESAYSAELNLWGSDLIGARVYATEADVDAAMPNMAEATTEWDDIGEINDILLTRDGAVEAVIVGVGGFLGIGEKDVAIDMTQIKFVSDGEDADEYFLVINSNEAAISDAPPFKRPEAGEANAMEDGGMVKDETTAEKAEMLTGPAIERDGYEATMWADLNTEDLTGARVYGVNDEDVGEISELLLTESGKLDRAVVDVGGFLGLGEHPVAVDMKELTIMRSNETGDFRVYIDSTEDKLESLPQYEG